ncbi:hypothetical protein NE612_06910 [Oscillibacter valericigenes]|nr:hypothetical protein [Oscillibacter valericigenes]
MRDLEQGELDGTGWNFSLSGQKKGTQRFKDGNNSFEAAFGFSSP